MLMLSDAVCDINIGSTAIKPKNTAPTTVILGQNLADIVTCVSSGSDTGDKSAALLHIVSHFNRIELNSCVEICEEQYQQEVQNSVNPM